MGVWTEPSPSDFDRWEQLIAEGADPSLAARELGFRGSSQFKRADPHRHAEALSFWRSGREEQADEQGDTWAFDPDASDQMKIAWLKRWNPAWAGASRIEVTGDGGGPVQLEAKRVVSLGEVVDFVQGLGYADEFGLPAGAARPALPGAPDVLPDPPDDQ